VAGLNRNDWQVYAGISGRFEPEYAFKWYLFVVGFLIFVVGYIIAFFIGNKLD
jgi:hypothetical protein